MITKPDNLFQGKVNAMGLLPFSSSKYGSTSNLDMVGKELSQQKNLRMRLSGEYFSFFPPSQNLGIDAPCFLSMLLLKTKNYVP